MKHGRGIEMAKSTTAKKSKTPRAKEGITRISVAGFKSIRQEQSIEIRPLTILAGANSSGKSSIMQPLLLLKQTLEATYDPGPLRLDGPNVKFTSADQLLSYVGKEKGAKTFQVGIGIESGRTVTMCFIREPSKGFAIRQMISADGERKNVLHFGMSHDEILPALPPHIRDRYEAISDQWESPPEWIVMRERCFLMVALVTEMESDKVLVHSIAPGQEIEPYIRKLIHLPGLRGNPERTYPVTAVGSTFPGTFEKYAASVIAQWKAERNGDGLEMLNQDLEKLGLTWKVTAQPVNDTQVELQVGRLAHAARGGARDLVNIADVGFGVSQTLPVLVALHVANPGQLLYLEQPEIHLHPRAQFTMAEVLADAAKRGVRVVAETHSDLLLLGVQTLVAEGKLSPESVKLHWFNRCNDGSTKIASADLDQAGTFGDWPEDFGQVALKAEDRYLDAVASQRWKH
jgi:predicted ATPase